MSCSVAGWLAIHYVPLSRSNVASCRYYDLLVFITSCIKWSTIHPTLLQWLFLLPVSASDCSLQSQLALSTLNQVDSFVIQRKRYIKNTLCIEGYKITRRSWHHSLPQKRWISSTSSIAIDLFVSVIDDTSKNNIVEQLDGARNCLAHLKYAGCINFHLQSEFLIKNPTPP